MSKYVCIYHGNCADGFGAAMAVRKYYKNEDIYYHKGLYRESPPPVDMDTEVIIVDFSYKRDVLIELANKAKCVLIIDHHKSAELDLVDLPHNVTTIFNLHKSGAMLAWEYFHKSAPTLIHYIQDRDLWNFDMQHSREISAAIFSYKYNFDVWERLLNTNLDDLVHEGASILRKHNKDIQELLPTAFEHTIGGHAVPTVNVPYFMGSDICSILCKDKPFAAYFYVDANYINYGLRSDKDGLDVSLIASEYGGGGHKHAAGFKVPKENK